jgi:hypothetical protein
VSTFLELESSKWDERERLESVLPRLTMRHQYRLLVEQSGRRGHQALILKERLIPMT